MGRPCEEVVVISDHEEGEITDSDFEPSPSPSKPESPKRTSSRPLENGFTPVQKPKHIPREETRWRPLPKKIGRNASFIRDGRTPIRHLKARSVVIPKTKSRKVNSYKSSSSDSETPEKKIPVKKKLSKLAPPKKSNTTCLKTRLSNMLKYSDLMKKTKRKQKRKESAPSKALKNAHLHSDFENLSSDNVFSEISDIENFTEKPIDNGDMSEDDPDLLRQLALQSKTKKSIKEIEEKISNEPNGKCERLKSDNEHQSPDMDDEINELRMAALKSAMLKKALKRKRITKDQKRKRDRLPSLLSNLENEIENDAVRTELTDRLSPEIGLENLDYSSYMYNVSEPTFLEENGDINETNVGKVNLKDSEVKRNEDDPDENEDMLRLNLLASLKNHPDENEDLLRLNLLTSMKNQQKPPSVEAPSSSIKNVELDSSLVLKLQSDSESECEATKNLAVLHKKLTEQSDFQRNLDIYLKGARQVVSESNSYNKSQEINDLNSSNEKIPSNVKNLTKSSQQEYHRLMLRLRELEESKQSTISYKKLDESKKSLNSTNTIQNINGIKKEPKQVLKPSILINRSANHVWQRLPVNTDRSQKVFENQLAFIRKQIINHSEMMEKYKTELTSLQTKRVFLLRQIKSLTLSLNTTDKALVANRRNRSKTSLQLIKFQKQQMILQRCQNRSSKSTPRKSSENVPPKLPSITVVPKSKSTPFLAVTDNNLNETPRTEIGVINNLTISIKDVDDGKRSVHVEPTLLVSPIEHSNLNKYPEGPLLGIDKTTFNSDENVPNSNLDHITNGTEILTENTAQYMEYHSSLIGFNTNQSWNHDPQAILCPFDVGGCCKDPSCTYAHLKI